MPTMNEVYRYYKFILQQRTESRDEIVPHGKFFYDGVCGHQVFLAEAGPVEWSYEMALNAEQLRLFSHARDLEMLLVFEGWLAMTPASTAWKAQGGSLADHPEAVEVLHGVAQRGNERWMWVHQIRLDGTVEPTPFSEGPHQFELLRLSPNAPQWMQEQLQKVRLTLGGRGR